MCTNVYHWSSLQYGVIVLELHQEIQRQINDYVFLLQSLQKDAAVQGEITQLLKGIRSHLQP